MSLFWWDTVSSYRMTDLVEGLITSQRESLRANNVPCHYSRGGKKASFTQGATTIKSEQLLFCALTADIREGDRLVITQRNGNVINATAGEAFPYPGGQQIVVRRDDVL